MTLQRTLKSAVSLRGVGVHSGKMACVTIRPAPPATGIRFIRVDLKDAPVISAHFRNVVSTQMATTLGVGKVTVSTVEHLLAALQGLQIDNAILEIDGPEVPIMDGSSKPFCDALEEVGVESQLYSSPYLALRKKIELKLGEKWVFAEPSARLEVFSSVEWDHPSIGYQEFHFRQGKTSFDEISSARTFGFLQEVEALKKRGLARGGSLENAVVLNHALVLNPEGLRFSDEFVRHKILDTLGDLKLAGMPIRAFIRVHRGGHDVHFQLLKEIFKDPDNYEIVEGMPLVDEMVSAALKPILEPTLATG